MAAAAPEEPEGEVNMSASEATMVLAVLQLRLWLPRLMGALAGMEAMALLAVLSSTMAYRKR